MSGEMIVTGVLCLLSVALGFWTSRRGRPLNVALNTVHKLLAVGLAAATGALLFGGDGFGALPADARMAGILAIAAILALFASGAVLSGKERKNAWLWIHKIGTGLYVLALSLLIGSFIK